MITDLTRFIDIRDRTVLVVRDMGETFLRKHVTRGAAALSYYLTLSIFPFLICISAILGRMRVQETDAFSFLADILPIETFSALFDLFGSINEYSTELILIIGLSAMLTSSSAAFRAFTVIMGEIQGQMRFRGIRRGIFSFIFSIAFLAAIYASGLVILTGEWLMHILETNFGFGDVFALWASIRFLILFLVLFCSIYGVYIISAPKEGKKILRLPGAVIASIVLVIASTIFSRMITASIRYALLYGSLASFIIMMIWLYVCGIILIMGNVFNVSLHKTRM